VLVHNECKKVPNPNGKKGGTAHQNVINSITPSEEGGRIVNEVRFNIKPYRFADAVEFDKNNKIKAIYQVGKVNKNGTVIARESRAIADIMTSLDAHGVPVHFLPYNSDIGEIIFDY
jgi:hypothetical protein